MGIIHIFTKKLKSFGGSALSDDVFTVLLIIFVALSSFALGRLSIGSGEDVNFSIEYDESQAEIWSEYMKNREEGKRFMASRTGTKYYPVNCGAGNRIKEENRIYFNTEDEASGAGYERTSTCGNF